MNDHCKGHTHFMFNCDECKIANNKAIRSQYSKILNKTENKNENYHNWY